MEIIKLLFLLAVVGALVAWFWSRRAKEKSKRK